jgi:hypothetical protein
MSCNTEYSLSVMVCVVCDVSIFYLLTPFHFLLPKPHSRFAFVHHLDIFISPLQRPLATSINHKLIHRSDHRLRLRLNYKIVRARDSHSRMVISALVVREVPRATENGRDDGGMEGGRRHEWIVGLYLVWCFVLRLFASSSLSYDVCVCDIFVSNGCKFQKTSDNDCLESETSKHTKHSQRSHVQTTTETRPTT